MSSPSRPPTTSPPGSTLRVLVTWMVLTPLVVSIQTLAGPVLGDVATPLRTAIVCAVVVPVMTLLALPAAMRTAARLLARAHRSPVHARSTP
jgi:antibiotic biosynthesis monooxygenase (ABM) superfamily enzyme